MHPVCIEALARQHVAEIRAGQASRRRLARQQLARPAGEPAAPMRQRVGWVLIQVGLRLAVGQGRT